MINTSLVHHFENAKAHGVTQKEIAAMITHIAFYAGWPKGWAAFNLAKDVWSIDEGDLSYEDEAMRAHAKKMIFPIGEPNDKFAQYFTGKSFLAPVSTSQVGIFNVTFEPGCRNNWHIHHAKSGGGQILICIAGRGYYQEEGKEAKIEQKRCYQAGLLQSREQVKKYMGQEKALERGSFWEKCCDAFFLLLTLFP